MSGFSEAKKVAWMSCRLFVKWLLDGEEPFGVPPDDGLTASYSVPEVRL